METIDRITQIISIISTLQPGDWLVVDVDNTLIIPTDDIFKSNSPYKDFIDILKQQKPHNLETNLSKWRLKRTVKLVENEWPEILEIAKTKEIFVYALTKMDTGTYGIIKNLEKWRADELAKMNLVFANYAEKNIEVLITGKSNATIYKGIMFTGAYKKSEVLNAFMAKQETKPKHLIFVDDRKEQAQDIENWCTQNNIAVTACHYTACHNITGTVNHKRSFMQLKSFENGNWLSDSEADAILGIYSEIFTH